MLKGKFNWLSHILELENMSRIVPDWLPHVQMCVYILLSLLINECHFRKI